MAVCTLCHLDLAVSGIVVSTANLSAEISMVL